MKNLSKEELISLSGGSFMSSQERSMYGSAAQNGNLEKAVSYLAGYVYGFLGSLF